MDKNNRELIITRPEPFFRIQRKDEYGEIIKHEKYLNAKQIEVRYFDIYGRSLFNKKGAECRYISCMHLREENKGYPIGYVDYLTYDERYERNIRKYKERNSRHSNNHI